MRRRPPFLIRLRRPASQRDIQYSWQTILTASPYWTVMSRCFRAGPSPVPLPGPPPERHQGDIVDAMTTSAELDKEIPAGPSIILDTCLTRP